LRNSMMRVSPEPGCDADFRRVAAASRNRTPKAEGSRGQDRHRETDCSVRSPSVRQLRSCVAVPRQWSLSAGRAMQKRRPSQCYLRAASTANCGKRLRSCAADCDRPKWVTVQIAVLACSVSSPPSQAPRCIICKKVKPCILGCPRNCQLIHTVVPTKDISIGRAPAKCGKGGSSDVLITFDLGRGWDG
jgi:hypothetical protein